MRKPKGLQFWIARIYLMWAGLWFLLTFLMLFPFFMATMHHKLTSWLTVPINKFWCIIYFPLIGIPIPVKQEGKLPKGPVVYAVNHSSYLDIPVLTWALPKFICFIGKEVLGKIPLFGYMFRKLHITVNRRSSTDRFKAFQLSLQKIDEGRSLVVFPEGGIPNHKQPALGHFKDGAFRMAIEKKVPIVPVTIAHNWYIYAEDGNFLGRWYRSRVIIHKAIETKGLADSDVEALSQKVFGIIANQLEVENRPLINKLKYES